MHERKITIHKIISFIFAFIFFISALNVCNINTAKADGTAYPFDKTDVLEDLESSETFSLTDYYWDYYGIYKSPSIMNFVEWCYSPFHTDDFALYIYFYNPQALDIDEDSPMNNIQMASAYSSYPITRSSVPTDYDTYPLVFCNMSMRENYEGMFYKFRVIDQKGSDGMYLRERVYSGERRYDVSGVTLATEDGKIKEHGVGGTYYFSGYASGYGPNEFAESTLKNSGFQPLETISLEVHPTVYRQNGYSNLGDGHQWDINSVYFSVPERFFKNYGALQKIKAEWWEYETQPILVTDNNTFYEGLKRGLGINIGESNNEIPYGIANWSSDYDDSGITYKNYYGYRYNHPVKSSNLNGDSSTMMNALYLLFNCDSINDDILITSSQMTEYIKNYSASSDKGFLPTLIDGKQISADLFTDTLSNGRAEVNYADDIHHKLVNFDANDEFDMLSYDSNHSGFEKWLTYLFNPPTTNDQYKNISPIVTDISNYISLSESNLAKSLLINKADVNAFKAFYNDAKVQDERTVLFRFAMTDYYSEKTNVVDSAGAKKGTALVAKESVFLNFKIIHLTFQADGVYTVIPVTQNPINVINSITKNPEPEEGIVWNNFLDWLKGFGKSVGSWGMTILGIVALVVLVIFTLKLLKLASGIGHSVIKTIILVSIIIVAIVVGIWLSTIFFGVAVKIGGF